MADEHTSIISTDIELQNAVYLVNNSGHTLRITTMTISITLQTLHPFCLSQLHKSMTDTNFCTTLGVRHGGTWSLKETSGFYNCLIINRITEEHKPKKLAIKIFRNGKLHMTGIQTCTGAIECANMLIPLLQQFDQRNTLNHQGFAIQLINGCCKIPLPSGYVLSLPIILQHLQHDYTCYFNSDHHPGIRVKLQTEQSNTITIIIFESGSILLTAFLSGSQLLLAYKFIVQIQTHLHKYLTPDIKRKILKRKFDYSSIVLS